jgi:O-acetyl-ADP-ribose deacetylase (regulator of RNase III)
MQIQLLRTDTTSLKLDAIVFPNEDAAAAGDDPGKAVVSTGGNLLCRFVIHVNVPSAGEGDADAKLRAATIAALERAEELAIASVGLPAIGTGTFGFTNERCARVMLSATMDFRSRARSLQRAVFCLFGKEEYQVFTRVLGELEG